MKLIAEYRKWERSEVVTDNAKRSALKIRNREQRNSFRSVQKVNSPIRLTEAPYLSDEHQTERFLLIHSEPVLQAISDRINFAFSKKVTIRPTEEEVEFRGISLTQKGGNEIMTFG